MLLYGINNGPATLGTVLNGLFTPDSLSMKEAYDPSRFDHLPSAGHGNMVMFSCLFGNTEGNPTDPGAVQTPFNGGGFGAKEALAVGAAALLFKNSGSFSLPMYAAYLMGAVPYNEGGLTPMLWNSGAIPANLGGLWGGWGATAGWLT